MQLDFFVYKWTSAVAKLWVFLVVLQKKMYDFIIRLLSIIYF